MTIKSTYPEQPIPEKPSFEALYTEHQPRVLDYLNHRMPPRDAEDVAQDAWVSALKAWPRFEMRAQPVKAWLLRIAKNAMLDYYGSAKRREYTGVMYQAENAHGQAQEFSFLDSLAEAGGEDEAAVCNRLDALERLGRVLCRDEQAAILRGMGYSYPEIQTHFGVGENHARVMVYRGRQLFQGKTIR